MMLLSKTITPRILVSHTTTLCIQSLTKQNSVVKALANSVSHFSSSSSSSSSSSNNNNNKNEQPPTFRARRRSPKNFQAAPKPKFRSRRAKAPIKLTSQKPNATLESTYGTDTAAAIRYVRRTKEQNGAIHPETLFSDAETTMRHADYLTADIGSTEDLVGERRAMMDAWDSNQAEAFQKELEQMSIDQGQFSFKNLPWNEDTEKDNSGRFGGGAASSSDEDKEEDPNQKAFGPWSETIIRVDRVQKVQRGGTMVRYRALVVGGNLNGCAGFGVAKANAPNEAAAAAARIAKRNLFFVDRYLNTGLTTDLAGRHNSCKVTLRCVNPNRGLHGHPLVLEILKYFGITDCSAKSHGNRNVYNVVYATFKAILTHESLEDVAMKRGKRLLNLERAKRLSI